MAKIKKMIDSERYNKNEKEEEGSAYVKEARSDLQKICRVLLQKKLENENLNAEVGRKLLLFWQIVYLV